MTKSDHLHSSMKHQLNQLIIPTKRETVVLKVYIHCAQCQKQVKKVLKKLDGIESIAIDAEMGKVTVVGIVPATTLIKKLSKAGKFAALWSTCNYNNSSNTSSTNNYSSNLVNLSTSGSTTNSGYGANHHHKTKDHHNHHHHQLYSNNPKPTKGCDFINNNNNLINHHYNNNNNSSTSYNGDMHHLLSNKNNSSRFSSSSTCSTSDIPKLSSGSSSSSAFDNVIDITNYNDMYPALDYLNTDHIPTTNIKKSKGSKRVSFTLPNDRVSYNQFSYNNYDQFSITPSVSEYHQSTESVEYATNMFSDENAHNCTIM